MYSTVLRVHSGEVGNNHDAAGCVTASGLSPGIPAGSRPLVSPMLEKKKMEEHLCAGHAIVQSPKPK